MSETWVSLTGWGLAHVVNGSEEQFLGMTYAKTLCGRRVKVEDVSADGQQDRCQHCSRRVRTSKR
jgi:hypothetical protein